MNGKIYNLPNLCLFYKPYVPVLLNKLRNKHIADYKIKVAYQQRINNYIRMNTKPRIIFEWSSYTSEDTNSESSKDSGYSFVSANSIGSPGSDWVDMKKLN